MKNFIYLFFNLHFILISMLITNSYSMPGSEGEEGAEAPAATTTEAGSGETPAPSGGDAGTTDQSALKATPLKWPDTIEVSEDNKKLLLSNDKEIVQLFTLAQDVCKNMDDMLITLNTSRDEANAKYRNTIKELDPLLERIGSTQAENKNRKEIS
ncbi:hypothetical protein FJ364_02960 [Candidatus Dependentiae bacterium]|nr:hypothetical protein [Candidatus Dependentiae bacterium]